MERWDKLLDGNAPLDDVRCHIEDSFQNGDFEIMHETISESLGNGNVVEIDPETGAFTLHDSEYGVTLSATQVLILESFLSSYGSVYLPFAFAAVEAGAC